MDLWCEISQRLMVFGNNHKSEHNDQKIYSKQQRIVKTPKSTTFGFGPLGLIVLLLNSLN
jgi:hypothetical protein